MQPIHTQLKHWGTTKLCEEASKLIRDKGDDANWQPFMRELIVRALGNPPTRKTSTTRGVNSAELEHRLMIQSQQLKGALKLNEYLTNQVRQGAANSGGSNNRK